MKAASEYLVSMPGGVATSNSVRSNSSWAISPMLTEKNTNQNILYLRRGSASQDNACGQKKEEFTGEYAVIGSDPQYDYAFINAQSPLPGQFATGHKGNNVEPRTLDYCREGVAIPRGEQGKLPAEGAPPTVPEGNVEYMNQRFQPRQMLSTEPGLVPVMGGYHMENTRTKNCISQQFESDDYSYNTICDKR